MRQDTAIREGQRFPVNAFPYFGHFQGARDAVKWEDPESCPVGGPLPWACLHCLQGLGQGPGRAGGRAGQSIGANSAFRTALGPGDLARAHL